MKPDFHYILYPAEPVFQVQPVGPPFADGLPSACRMAEHIPTERALALSIDLLKCGIMMRLMLYNAIAY